MTVPAAIKRAGKNRNGTSVGQYILSGSCSNSESESNIESLWTECEQYENILQSELSKELEKKQKADVNRSEVKKYDQATAQI